MPSLLEILKDPNYVNANSATKAAIFDKYSTQDSNYTDANDATKAAIRSKFGIGSAIASEVAPGKPADTRNPEDVGFFEGLGAAAKKGFNALADSASGLSLAGSSVFGSEEDTAKKMADIKAGNIEEAKGTKTLTASDIQRIAEERGLVKAGTQVPAYIAEQLLQSAPSMALPLAVGAAASPFITPVGGAIAGIATYGIQQFGNFLARQAEAKNDPQELEVAKAALTAAGTAPIGYFVDRFTLGLGSAGKTAGKEALAELAKRRALDEIGAGAVTKEVLKRAGKGATVGILAEAPTEVIEQVAERYQAGLSLDDAEAMNEYKEAFFGAAAVGGALGGGSRAAQAYGGYKSELSAAKDAAAPGTSTFDLVGGENARIGVDPGARQLSLPGFDEAGGPVPGTNAVVEGDVAGTALPPSSVGSGETTTQASLDLEATDFNSWLASKGIQEADIGSNKEYDMLQNAWRSESANKPAGVTPPIPPAPPVDTPPIPPKLTEAQVATRQDLINKIKEAQAFVNEQSQINPDDDRIPGAIARIQQLDTELKQLETVPAVAKPLPAPSQGGFEFGEADDATQRSVGEAIPRAKLNFAADTNRPLDAVTNFLGALKPDTSTPQQVTNYNSEVKGILEDLREFFGQPAKMVQSRMPGVKAPDVSAELSDRELQLKSALIDDFFNKASITPEAKKDIIPGVLAKLPQMNAEQQRMALSQLVNFPKLNTVRGIKDFRAELDDVLTSYEQFVLNEETGAMPFTTGGIQEMTPRIMSALTKLDKTPASQRTPEEKAAYIYFTRKVVGADPYNMTMRSAAYDLGVDIDEKFKGAIRKGETKENAELFKAWIEDNLPQQQYRRFMATVKDFERMTRRGEKYAEETRDTRPKKKPELASTYVTSLHRAPSGDESGFDTRAEIQPGMSRFVPSSVVSFAPMHPAVQEFVDRNDIKGALNALAGDKSTYLGRTAARLAEIPFNTSVQFDGQETLIDNYIDAEFGTTRTQLNKLLEAVYPELYSTAFRGKGIRDTHMALQMLKSGKFKGVDTAPIVGEIDIMLEAYEEGVKLLDTSGTYFPHLDAITLNTQFGGRSNYAFIHEVTHAATSWSLDPNNFDKLNKTQQRAVGELNKLWEKARTYTPTLTKLNEKGKKVIISEEGKKRLKTMYDYGIKNIDEFVAEALSNRRFQEQLSQIKYEGDVSFWDKLINLIARVVGFDNVLGHTLANAHLILQAPPALTPHAKALAASKVALSSLDGTRQVGDSGASSGNLLQEAFRGRPAWNYMKESMPFWLESLKDATRKHYLGAFTLRQLEDMVGRKIPQFKAFINQTETMLEDRSAILNKTSEIAEIWQNFQSKSPKLAKILNFLMIDATVDGIDPSLNNGNTGNESIDKAWQDIGIEGQKIYTEVKKFYEQRLADYTAIILERKAESLIADGISEAVVKSHPEYIKIKDQFSNNILKPYFPLRRFGKYWVQFGTGKDKEFYQFESAIDRNMFASSRKEQLKGTKKMSVGNDIKNIISSNVNDFAFLKELKKMIQVTPGATKSKYQENLEDSLEQLYLLTLPDQSVRKMFLNRQGIQGMNSDMLRAFTSSAFHMAYQQTRFKHSPKLYSLVDGARGFLKDNDDEQEVKVSKDYIGELEKRLDYIANPPDTGTIPAFLSNMSFIWYMTAPASALVNMLGVPAVGIPVMGAKFGNIKASKKVFEFTKKFASAGFTKDGKAAFPSLANKAGLLTAVQQKAYDKFVVDGLIDITMQHDLVGMAEAPSNLYTGRGQRIMKVLSGAFHGAEKFNREVVAMSSFDLAMEYYAKPTNGGYKGDRLVEKAIDVAKELTYKSMFDYSTLNKPRYFQSASAKVVLQFKQFAQQMSVMLARSAYEGFYQKFDANEREDIGKEINTTQRLNGEPEYLGSDLEKQVDKYISDMRKEGKNRLMGTLGMTFAFAGATGMPGWWAFSKSMEALQAVFGDDDEADKPFNFDNWFKNWAADTFGGYAGDSISRGVVSQTFGVNVADRMGLNSLFFQDPRNSPDETTAFQAFIVSLMGPSMGIAVNGIEAFKQIKNGYIWRGFETATPAVIKNALKGIRLSDTFGEGKATNLKGNVLIDDLGIGEVVGQSIGFSPERLAQRQKANIEMKTAEQELINKRQALLNAYFMAFDTQDSAFLDRTMEKITRFNKSNPTMGIKGANLSRSVRDKYRQRLLSQLTGGMNINKKLINELGSMGEYGNPDE